jgi:glutamyl-tRNA synthetase
LDGAIAEDAENKLLNGMPGLKVRANNITELSENAKFYISKNPIPISKKAQNILDEHGVRIVNLVQARLSKIDCWTREEIEATARQTAENAEVNLGKITQPLRAALTGSTASPSIFEVIEVLGRQETMARLRNFS